MKKKKNKNKIISAVIIIIVLAIAFFCGGNAPGLRGTDIENKESISLSKKDEMSNTNHAYSINKERKESKSASSADKSDKTQQEAVNNKKIVAFPYTEVHPEETTKPEQSDEKNLTEQAKTVEGTENNPQTINNPPVTVTKTEEFEDVNNTYIIQSEDEAYSRENKIVSDKKTVKDKYMTEPVEQGKPFPIEPQKNPVSDKELTCTLSVRCDTIMDNIDWLDKDKRDIVPKDGIIFKEKTVVFYDGESVFNLLLREMKGNKIHMEFENTPMYNSAYIEGIANLYEFDCGELSGWMYKVNDWFPNYGCSRYQLKEGDKVEWVYTCDLGRDVGGYRLQKVNGYE